MNIGSVSENLKDLSDFHSYLIAYSGGVDSHVLLHALAHLRAQSPELRLRAMHINHGLNEHADDWALHCERVCDALDIPFLCERVAVLSSGNGIESAARTARYRVLSDNLDETECLLTAHTQDDQAETLLLQLLRGAGPTGLSAMPFQKPFAHSLHFRPFLSITRNDVLTYAKAHALSWVEDDSNTNVRFDRNYLRHDVMPLLTARWPSAINNLSRSARHCSNASALLTTLAEEDLLNLHGTRPNTLSVSALLRLPKLRRANALRQWFLESGERAPSTQQLAQLQNDVLRCDADADPVFLLEKKSLRRYRDDVYLIERTQVDADTTIEIPWDCRSTLKLPGNLGELHPQDFLHFDELIVRFRRGGETIKSAGSEHTRSLKKLFQQWGVPPWERGRVPLLFDGDRLIAVYGYCRTP